MLEGVKNSCLDDKEQSNKKIDYQAQLQERGQNPDLLLKKCPFNCVKCVKLSFIYSYICVLF